MKISLTISLFFHVIIFTFLNIYRNEEISDELISNVSVISQKKYDALISNKPIITNLTLLATSPSRAVTKMARYRSALILSCRECVFVDFDYS